jgi:hypothetical protein
MTPVEAFRITVEDLPFVIIAADYVDQNSLGFWQFTNNTGDLIDLLQSDQLLVTYDSEQQPKPKLWVRDGLWGRINRSVFYQLALACEVVETSQGEHAQLISGPYQYGFGPI